jgi:hypothetical protein
MQKSFLLPETWRHDGESKACTGNGEQPPATLVHPGAGSPVDGGNVLGCARARTGHL